MEYELSRLESRVDDIRRDLYCKADRWNVDSLGDRVSYLESALDYARSEISSLRDELAELRAEVAALEDGLGAAVRDEVAGHLDR